MFRGEKKSIKSQNASSPFRSFPVISVPWMPPSPLFPLENISSFKKKRKKKKDDYVTSHNGMQLEKRGKTRKTRRADKSWAEKVGLPRRSGKEGTR